MGTLLCGVACFTEAAAAQQAASVSGFVYTLAADRVQTAWPNARITLKNVVAEASYATVTNFTGEFFFSEILPGTYELTVTLEGFEVEQRRVELAPGTSQRVEIRLQPRGVRETVRVGGTAPAEPDPLGKSPDGLPQNVLKSVPLLEDQFQDALPLVPGVVRGPDGLLNLRGARSTQSGTLVNTTSVVDPVTGQSAISLPLEAVDAVRVLSNPYSAEYGRFTGAVVEVDTRSGTDRWRFGVDNFLPR
ncbi:MAG: carboxypeptidase regulatory-like domain-containing protein, partial [Candidatus Acidiferrales bacterium]